MLLRVESVAICGSDLHIYKTGLSGGEPLGEPMIPGHEACAIVEGGDTPVPAGTRVAIEPAIPCMRCEFCVRGDHNLCPNHTFLGLPGWPGAMRERMVHPAHLIEPVPDSIPPKVVPLLEPLAIAVHASDLSHARLGQRVAVIGLGVIGLMIVRLMRLMGCRVIACDPVPERAAMAEEFGAERAINATGQDAVEDMLEWTSGRGVDVAIEVAGPNEAVRAATELAAPGARVLVIGIQPDDQIAFRAATARRKGLTIAMLRRSRNTLGRAIELYRTGQVSIDALATHEFPLDRAADAFAQAASYADGGIRTIVHVS
ncbi:MAG: zinc-binding dehydrogenase [Phycisphaerae bacterium]|nr:zinc-binding dehydrogenase [Phycisphaerae bacterium]